MLIADILSTKGATVITVAPTDTVSQLASLLAEHRIGAVVVSADGTRVDGIVSERDVMRALPTHGAALLDKAVEEIMTRDVLTCQKKSTVTELAVVMTENRFRHMPVVEDERLIGIVSIGDVVKARTELLEDERDQLIGYVQQ